MRINVKFFAILKDRAGVSSTVLDLPNDSTVSTAVQAIQKIYPSMSNNLNRVAFAVNRNYSKSDVILHDGDELALIPPVSGG